MLNYRKPKQIFDNSEPMRKRRKRPILTDSIRKLIEIPSEEEQRKEREDNQREENRRREREKEMEGLQRELEELERQKKIDEENKRKKNEFAKNVEKDANNLREKMSDEEIRKIFKINLKYFQKIKNGFVQSWRHSMYHSSENKAENQRFLRSKMIGFPFSDKQQDIVYEEVRRVWLNDQKAYFENNQYIELVLLPEVFILLYQKFLKISSSKIAEERIFNPGSMNPDDRSPEHSLFLN